MNNVIINAPQLNSNDDELLVLDIFIKKNEKIKKGDKIFLLETSKTSVEIEADYEGKISEIFVKKNEYIKVGHKLYEIITDAIDINKSNNIKKKKENEKIDSKKISLKALKLIQQNNINIKDLDYIKGEIKTQQVLEYLNKIKKVEKKTDNTSSSIIIGSGLHAIEIASVLISDDKKLLGFSSKDDENIGDLILGEYTTICSDNTLNKIENLDKKNIYIGVGGAISNLNRKNIFEKFLEKKFNLPSLISNKANVSKFATIGKGTIVLPGATIGPNVHIGENCIINCNSIISHGSIIGNHVHMTQAQF